MQKGYVTVFYLQMNNVEFDIFGTLTANYSVYFNRNNSHKYKC